MKRSIVLLVLLVIAVAAVFLLFSTSFEQQYSRLAEINDEFGVDENMVAPFTINEINLYEERLKELDAELFGLSNEERALKDLIEIRIAAAEMERNFLLAGERFKSITPESPNCAPSGNIFIAIEFAKEAKVQAELALELRRKFIANYSDFADLSLVGQDDFSITLENLIAASDSIQASLQSFC